ncbi:MAG: nucleoside hydrolase, partial [Rhodoferax sp.]|nr:nucleoside hydrolase [Rhodoferax sp.]
MRMQRRVWVAVAFLAVVVSACGGGSGGGSAAAPKIIIDSDYNTMSDDGQLGVMAAQLQAQGKVQVMGISV